MQNFGTSVLCFPKLASGLRPFITDGFIAYVDTTTPIIVTDYPYERYQIATYSLGAMLVFTLVGLALVTVALVRARGVQPTPQKTAYY